MSSLPPLPGKLPILISPTMLNSSTANREESHLIASTNGITLSTRIPSSSFTILTAQHPSTNQEPPQPDATQITRTAEAVDSVIHRRQHPSILKIFMI
ncbi:hypothetical protein TNCV_601821 [Trichonephila clavipes]|nr:hypothetical protein TNCV_601821 [Trichonephila clavipes]